MEAGPDNAAAQDSEVRRDALSFTGTNTNLAILAAALLARGGLMLAGSRRLAAVRSRNR